MMSLVYQGQSGLKIEAPYNINNQGKLALIAWPKFNFLHPSKKKNNNNNNNKFCTYKQKEINLKNIVNEGIHLGCYFSS